MGRVLIADDEEKILDVMVDVLENAGHEVTAVPDGQSALDAMKEQQFDVALIDVMMPKMNGYQVVAQMQAFEHRPRVVIVTARNYDGDKVQIENVGVDAFLPKPFSNHDLVKVVQDLMARRPR